MSGPSDMMYSYLRKYRAVIESIDEGFCVVKLLRDASGRPSDVIFLEVNPAFERQTGITGIVGEGIKAIPGEHWECWLSELARVLETGEPTRSEVQFGDRCFDVHRFPFGKPSDNYVALLFDDITERKAAEGALREAERRFRTVIENAGDGIFMLDLHTGRHTFISPSVEKLTGFSAEELRALSAEDALARVHPHDRHIPRYQQAALAQHKPAPAAVRYRWQTKSGEYRWLRDRRSLVCSDTGEPVALVAVVSDITAGYRLEEALRKDEELHSFLLQLSDAIRPLSGPREVLRTASRMLGEHLGADYVFYARIDTVRHQWRAKTAYCGPGLTLVGARCDSADFPAIEETARRGSSVIVDDVGTVEMRGQAGQLMAESGIRSLVSIPLLTEESPIWVLTVASTTPRRWTEEETALINEVAQRTWDAVQRVGMEEKLRKSEVALDRALRAERTARQKADEELEMTRVLLRAAASLSEPMDSPGVYAALAEVLSAATGLRVTLFRWHEEDGSLEPAASSGDILPPAVERGWEMLDPAIRVCITEHKTVMSEQEQLPPPLREVTRAYGVRLGLHVPIVYRGRLLGIVSLDKPRERHLFTEREISLAEAIASQAAVSLDNARLYEAEHAVAETLQETLVVLPACIPGVTFSRSYESATLQPGRVGGDFVDVFEAHGHVVGITLGDVSGKGINAAVTTSLVRTTLRVHALDGLPPFQIATKANQAMSKFTEAESFVTLWFGLLDTKSGMLRYLCAGHPPAVLLKANGEMGELDWGSPLIGAYDQATYTDCQVVIEPGDRIVLYSDGATEARSKDGSFLGTERLLGLIERHRAEPTSALSDAIMREIIAFSGGVLRDDVAILVVEPVTLRLRSCDERQLRAFA